MKRHRLRAAALGVIALAVLSLAWASGLVSLPWTHDLDDQMSIRPQEKPMLAVEGTVPVTGMTDDGPRESAPGLANPVAADDTTSLRRGKNAYGTYCTPCHGAGGKGNGTVARSLPIPPVDLTRADLQGARTDGALYYTIRHGGALMPAYGYALSSERTWDVVNYIRTLRGS